MSIPVIPSLHGEKGYVTDRHERAIYLLNHFIMSPASVSEYYEEHKVSLRKLAAESDNDPLELVARVRSQLSQLYIRYFPGESIQVEVSAIDTDKYKYGLKLNITVQNDNGVYEPILLTNTIHITEDYRIETIFNT